VLAAGRAAPNNRLAAILRKIRAVVCSAVDTSGNVREANSSRYAGIFQGRAVEAVSENQT